MLLVGLELTGFDAMHDLPRYRHSVDLQGQFRCSSRVRLVQDVLLEAQADLLMAKRAAHLSVAIARIAPGGMRPVR